MSTPNQNEIRDSTAQENPAAADFSTAPQYERDKAQPKKSTFDILNQMAGGLLPPGTPIVQTETLPDFDGRAEPETEEPAFAGFGPLGAVVPEIGGPVVEPVAAPVSSVEDAVQLLRQEIAAAWGQDHVDDAAFAKVSHLTIVQVASANSPLIVADPVCDDEVMLGTREDGVQAVLGHTNITAAQALSRAQLAMTSARFKAEGVNEVHGTAMDKALLLLAAQDVGLTIVNEPEISAEVMAQAKAQWDALTAPATQAAEAVDEAAPVAASTAVQNGVQELEVTELPADGIPVLTDIVSPEDFAKMTLAASLKPEVQEILTGSSIAPETYVDLRDRLKSGQDKVLADHQGFINKGGITEAFRDKGIGADQTERLVQAMEADGLTYNATCKTTAPRTLINYQVPATKMSGEVTATTSLKPEVLEVLNGDRTNDNIAPEIYLDLRSRIKSGKDTTLANSLGFINKEGITAAFRDQGIGAEQTERLIQAMEADGLTYNAACETKAPRTVINHQVALRPGLRPW